MTGRQEYDRNMTGRQDDRQDDRQRILDEYMIDHKLAENTYKLSSRKLINEANTNALKMPINTDWQPVLTVIDEDSSFFNFCRIFSSFYDEHFPITFVRFNKNKHSINASVNDNLLERNINSAHEKLLSVTTPMKQLLYVKKYFLTGICINSTLYSTCISCMRSLIT